MNPCISLYIYIETQYVPGSELGSCCGRGGGLLLMPAHYPFKEQVPYICVQINDSAPSRRSFRDHAGNELPMLLLESTKSSSYPSLTPGYPSTHQIHIWGNTMTFAIAYTSQKKKIVMTLQKETISALRSIVYIHIYKERISPTSGTHRL